MPNTCYDNIYDCPFGISNQKELEKSNERNTLMLENVNRTLKELGKSMNEKFDEINNKMTAIDNKIDDQKDFLEGKINAINDTLEQRVGAVVENKFKVSVYSLVKWVIGVGGAAIVARLAISNFLHIR